LVRIGILWVRGAIPLYEGFGSLPTHLARSARDIESLDALIIPPGNIVESLGAAPELRRAVERFIEGGGIVLGICSGLQLLSKRVDTGLRIVEGLGVLDLEFSRLIALDWARVRVVGSSWVTKYVVGRELLGVHIHTYGPSRWGESPILVSSLPKHNYFAGPISIASGFARDNVVGWMPHLLLDLYEELRDAVLEELGVSNPGKVFELNRELRKKILHYLGVEPRSDRAEGCRKLLTVVSGESGEGKTFITTGIVAYLARRGFRVCVAKLGGDIRDLHPAMYVAGIGLEPWMGIAIRGRRLVFGWCGWREAIREALKRCDILVVEGVMGLLTSSSSICGCSEPCSTLEFVRCSRSPTVLVVSCSRGGIEDAVERARLYIEHLREAGSRILAVVLNEFYGDDRDRELAGKRLEHVPRVLFVPPMRMGAARVPEIDLDIHEFAENALRAAEEHLDVESLLQLAPCYSA